MRGIALSGQSSVAIVALESESNRLHRIALGGEIAGWRVTAIQRESVAFSTETIEARAYLGKPGEEPRVETTHHDAELARRKTPTARGCRLVSTCDPTVLRETVTRPAASRST